MREYFRRFGREWKYALFSWLIFLAIGLVIAFGIAFWIRMPPPTCYIVVAVLLFFAVWLVMLIEWFYPLQVRFVNKWGHLWKLALRIGWMQIGTSIALIAIDIAVVALAYFSKVFRVLFFIFGFSWVVYAKTLILLPAFDRAEHGQQHTPTSISEVGTGM